MKPTYFNVPLLLSVIPGRKAELVPPGVLSDLDFKFVRVKENGEEAIIVLEAAEPDLRRVEETPGCVRLTPHRARVLKNRYRAPRIKQKYRVRSVNLSEPAERSDPFERDEWGNRVIDIYQTVRSGIYIIDIPILDGPDGN